MIDPLRQRARPEEGEQSDVGGKRGRRHHRRLCSRNLRGAQKIVRYVRQRHVSFDQGDFKPATLAVKRFERLGNTGARLLGEVVTKVVWNHKDGGLPKEGALLNA